MKRFLLFTFESYYPGGGWADFAGDYGSVRAAKAVPFTLDYAHIVDTKKMEIVAEGERRGKQRTWLSTSGASQ